MSDTLYRRDKGERTEYYLVRGDEGVMLVGLDGMYTEGGRLEDTDIDAKEVSADEIPDNALEALKEAADREL